MSQAVATTDEHEYEEERDLLRDQLREACDLLRSEVGADIGYELALPASELKTALLVLLDRYSEDRVELLSLRAQREAAL